MSTDRRDPLHAMFHRYAEATVAEAEPPGPGRLRVRLRRHRQIRAGAAGVAVAALAVPASWAFQHLGGAESSPGPADGESSEVCALPSGEVLVFESPSAGTEAPPTAPGLPAPCEMPLPSEAPTHWPGDPRYHCWSGELPSAAPTYWQGEEVSYCWIEVPESGEESSPAGD
ncbi:hypothetical protein GCM10009853_010340 [Glycomyces scopariae]